MRKRKIQSQNDKVDNIIQAHNRKQLVVAMIFALVLCFAWSCDSNQKKDAKPPANKKIAVETKSSVAPAKNPPVAKPDIMPASPENAAKTDSLDKSGDVAEGRIYDPAGRIDPFAPLYRTDQEQKPPQDQGRVRTPLEKLGITQLKLVAIVRSASGNTALVEDGTGKGYTVKTGTLIGLNSGIVTEITQSSVMIREETETITGEPVVQNIEMKLQKPAGE